jgi:hypothetical protein
MVIVMARIILGADYRMSPDALYAFYYDWKPVSIK